MSGVKSGEVRRKLAKVIDAVRKQNAQRQKNTERLTLLGAEELEASRRAARQMSVACDPAAIADPALKAAADRVRASLAAGEREAAAVSELQKAAAADRCEAQQLLAKAERLSAEVEQALRSKDEHMEQEMQQAVEARSLANRALDLETRAGDKIRAALDHTRQSRNSLDAGLLASRAVAEQIEQARRLAEAQEKARLAAEADERKAGESLAELSALAARVQSLNHERFAPGEFVALAPIMSEAREAYSQKNHLRSSAAAEQGVAVLRPLAERVSRLQIEWETARIAAKNDLEMAEQEAAGFDQQMLEKYNPDPAAVRRRLAELIASRAAFEQEDFAAAASLSRESIAALRQCSATAAVNSAAAEDMDEVAQAIMQALDDVGYDTPVYNHAKVREDGSDDLLSAIEIFAKSPSPQGDMRLEVGLGGSVRIEMPDVPGQDGAVCHALIQDLQEKLGPEITLTVTDWGHAKNATTDLRSGVVKTKELVKEKTRDRRES